VIAVGLAVHDVDRSREHDEKGRLALALLEQDLPRGERQFLGAFRQLFDLSRREPWEQRRIVRVQEAGDWGR
jgi:hypothetical protein